MSTDNDALEATPPAFCRKADLSLEFTYNDCCWPVCQCDEPREERPESDEAKAARLAKAKVLEAKLLAATAQSTADASGAIVGWVCVGPRGPDLETVRATKAQSEAAYFSRPDLAQDRRNAGWRCVPLALAQSPADEPRP